MLKFIKHSMETIAGIEIFPIISLLIFFTFFVGLLVYVIAEDKNHMNKMKNLPLNDGVDKEL